MGYVHRRIKHSQKVYVRGNVHDQAPVLCSEVDSTRGGEQNSPAEPWAEARRKSLVAHDNWHFHSATRNGAPIPSKQDAIFHFRARGSDSSPNSCAMLNAQDTSASAKPGDRKPPQL
jgi:hypothetical protein